MVCTIYAIACLRLYTGSTTMLLLGSSFEKMPILSLRTGRCIGKVVGHVINPHKLCVDALWCDVKGEKQPLIIIVADIREVSPKGVIVDDHQVAVAPEEMIRLKPIIELGFELLDKKVLSGRLMMGRVTDYAVDNDSFIIRKIYAKPSVWNMLKTNRFTIDRAQVIEVSHNYVRVVDTRISKSESVRAKKIQSASLVPSASASITEE